MKGKTAANAASSAEPASDSPSWATETVRAKGTGVPKEGQTGTEARLNTERAAEAVARRNLVEKVYGVQIDATTTVRDYVTVNDQVTAQVEQYLAGARVVGEPTVMPDGSIEVEIELPLEGMWQIVSARSVAQAE
ncbi:MAG: LPP20 family lipoprotein, partial [Candidatus Aureabacteria bacterium]|nr:LPP20 family lipoprotein [Candidatus Auribacterota bacterium]